MLTTVIQSGQSKKLSTLWGYFLFIISVLVILYYYYIHFKLVVNVPIDDDYNSTLGLIYGFEKAGSLRERIVLLLAQHNEHRILLAKLITLAFHKLSLLNFKYLTLFGHLGLLVIFYFLLKASDLKNKSLIKSSLLVLALFQLQYYQASNWAITTLVFFISTALLLLCLFLLSRKDSVSFTVSILLAGIITFSSGNGMLVFPCGLIVLLVNRAEKAKLLCWMLFAAIFISLYFWNYHKPGHHPPILETVLNNPLNAILYFLGFTGSIFYYIGQGYAYTGGALFLLLFLWLTYKKYFQLNPLVFSLLVFIYLSAAAATVARVGFGVEQAFASRYILNSTFLLMGLLIGLIQIYSTIINGFPLLILSGLLIVFNISSSRYYLPIMQATSSELKLGATLMNRFGNSERLWFNPKNIAGQILSNCEKEGIYKIPAFQSPCDTNYRNYKVDPTVNVLFDFAITETQDLISINNGWALIENEESSDNLLCVCFTSASDTIVSPAVSQHRHDVTEHFKRVNYDDSGFNVYIHKARFKRGEEYTAELLFTNERLEKKILAKTGKKILVR